MLIRAYYFDREGLVEIVTFPDDCTEEESIQYAKEYGRKYLWAHRIVRVKEIEEVIETTEN